MPFGGGHLDLGFVVIWGIILFCLNTSITSIEITLCHSCPHEVDNINSRQPIFLSPFNWITSFIPIKTEGIFNANVITRKQQQRTPELLYPMISIPSLF